MYIDHMGSFRIKVAGTRGNSDQMALPRLYTVFYSILNIPTVCCSYTVSFVEQPSYGFLEICEDK